MSEPTYFADLFSSLDPAEDPAKRPEMHCAASDAMALLDTHLRLVTEILSVATDDAFVGGVENRVISELAWTMGGLHVLRDQLASIQSKADMKLERDAALAGPQPGPQ